MEPDAPDFDDNPDWTGADFARARPIAELHSPAIVAQLVRSPGRPALPAELRKRSVTLRLSPDVLERLRQSGRGWQTKVDEILREAMNL